MTNELKDRISKIRSGEVPEGYKKTVCGIIPDEWNICRFKQKFTRLKSKNCESNSNILTISAQYGLINQEEFFKKEVASDDKSNYYLLNKGDFAYNKSYSNGYPYGAVKPLTRYEKGIVSPLYICFSPADDSFCADYYTHYFESGLLNKEIHAIAQEGARNHGLLNVSVDDFFNTNILCPPLPEQKKIAEILSTQDKVIALIQKQIEELKKLKKAYLQKMFPQKDSLYPEIRFKGFTDAWEQRELGTITSSYSGGTPTAGKSEYYGGDIPFIRSGEIDEEKTELFLSELGYNNSSAAMVEKGDILYALYGATSGEVSISKLKGAINQAILAIKPNEGYDSEFMMQWLKNQKDNIISTYLQGGQGNLSGAIVKSLKVDITTYEEQQQIGTYFRSLDTLITLHQRKSEQEQQKEKALMQLLLTGIVRVKV